MRRILVWPSEMIWPANLPYIALLRTMHEPEKPLTPKWLNLSRKKFFVIICLGSMVYYWLPGYIMPVLTAFSWMCMINPRHVLLSQVTGNGGFGFGVFQFDWLTIRSSLDSPILCPRWAQLNILVGFILTCWLFIPILYFTNTWNWKSFPISNGGFFSPPGNPTDIYLSVTFVIGYNLFLASFAALVTHTILYHGKYIVKQFSMSLKKRQNDVHCQLMARYSDVPEWVYLVIFLCAFIIGCVTCHFSHLMPWYYLFLTVSISFICLLLTGIVAAKTNIEIDIVTIVVLLGGVIFKLKPLASLTFVTFAWSTQKQAFILISYLKFGHYMKISPKVMLTTQLIITILAAIIKYGITEHLLKTIEGLCTFTNRDWSCPHMNQLAIVFASNDTGMLKSL
ncbi:unnamed protein product [Didymodactylos carnosus]|uniref:Uncharacterized protein n=1 Tax=Didymodactylos carnosus TaxID=1234261 RepID=A0A815UF86_9BILA|nr:unnamed protein product [Didymodactylos carnosus]CAF1521839.1 unnamed protein product [Didymodactylos carnosus]CAF3522788.1 unnamed protein product [Didymodactylos carnosus]CAF4380989.1 unnamed protein product [Didymodactylos carnosus]